MICFKCGAVNDDKASVCSECHTTLSLAAKPSWDITHISDYNTFQDQILNKRFKIIKVLGRGGMGEIFLAEDNQLGRKVAIKSIGADSIRDNDSKTRFRREAEAASRLDHPNICTIYEIVSENGREYIVMQYVDGVTLDHLLKLKPMALGTIIDIALQITDGMIAAQEQNIVHRDLKPGNIMIDKSGKVKILDFGLAKIYSGKIASGKNSRTEADLTEKGIVWGTVSYMSPEQAKGLELDGRSDIFSFGVVLAELLAGKNLFSDRNNIITQYNILHKEIKLGAAIPTALRKIVLKALQKNRERRYSDFREIKIALTAVRKSLLQSEIERAKTFTEIIPASKRK
jgi:serine/threonine-protein kinase